MLFMLLFLTITKSYRFRILKFLRSTYFCECFFFFYQEHVELEKRYRELTDLLVCNEPVRFFCVLGTLALRANLILYGSFFQYHKQTQLESMASEKAALEFQLEKSLKQFHEVQVVNFSSSCRCLS
jgi:hypothetical protein